MIAMLVPPIWWYVGVFFLPVYWLLIPRLLRERALQVLHHVKPEMISLDQWDDVECWYTLQSLTYRFSVRGDSAPHYGHYVHFTHVVLLFAIMC